MKFYIYDKETMLNCYLFGGLMVDTGQIFQYEISARMNQRTELLQHLSYLQNLGVVMVGYNNLSFDYPILHHLLNNPYTFDFQTAYQLAQTIIKGGRFSNFIPARERLLPQIDLLKIHHFDNPAKATSLKALQFAMRSESVEDLPFAFNTELIFEEMDIMRHYNVHDLTETLKFFGKSYKAILLRQELLNNGVLTGDVLNYSDVKIGTEYLIKKIGRHKCFLSGSKPRQSLRQSVAFKDIILPKVMFRTDPYQAVHDWFKGQTIWISREDVRPKLSTQLAGLQFEFGLGGVHASVEKRVFRSTATHVIKDVDVSGMYPAVAIANGFAPEHLGQDFVTAYRQLKADREQHKKGTVMNLVLKLAGNGASGNFENTFSPLYDPKCAYSVRINGQLLLLQLAEMLALIPGLEMIQANTDGITSLIPREVEPFFNLWCNEWEAVTGLKLEHAEYDRMFIRDVNNYIAIDTKGGIKRKGAYWYPITEDDYQGSSGSNWNKDFSGMVIQKAAEACMINGYKPEDAVRLIADPFDFLLRYKTQSGSKLYVGDREVSKTLRYYVAKHGQPMKKISTPKGIIGQYKRKNSITDELYMSVRREIGPDVWDPRIHTKNKSKYEMTTTSVESGRLVKECNHIRNFSWGDVDFDYYAAEVQKLIIGDSHVV